MGASIQIMPCGHAGCIDCLNMWFMKQAAVDCPLCRAIGKINFRGGAPSQNEQEEGEDALNSEDETSLAIADAHPSSSAGQQ